MEERQSLGGEPDSKRIKLEKAATTPTDDTHTAAAHSASPSAASLSTSKPHVSSAHHVEAVLHGIDDANSALVHNTIAGELIEHERVEQLHQPQPMEEEETILYTDPTETEQQPDTALQSSPVSVSRSFAASPPPLQPLASPTPPPLGKYQCENCGAMLTYSSLTEIYHCPLCYHTFTLYPPLAPTTSPPLFPLDDTCKPLTHPKLSHFTSADLYLYLLHVPGLSSIAAKSAAVGMDGRYFMSMHVSDMVEEFGLWGSGGAGGSVEGNAALVVQLLNAQQVLRGESVRSVAEEKELVTKLIGMQTVPVASKPLQTAKSAKKARDRSDRPKKERDATLPADDAVDADNAAPLAAAEVVPARPVKRKVYRIPSSTPLKGSPADSAAVTPTMATVATVLPISDEQPITQHAAVVHDGHVIPLAPQQPSSTDANGSVAADAVTAGVVTGELADVVSAVQPVVTTMSDEVMNDVAPSTALAV